MKIYTKTGDQGETGLLGGVRVNKSHPGVETCGCLDETNCWIGLANSQVVPDKISAMLIQIQNDLFDLGSRVAACSSETSHTAKFPPGRIEQLEQWIDQLQQELPELKAFILPGGSQSGSSLHLARSVCRRTERRLVELMGTETKRDLSDELVYLNRLGDLLFVCARFVNQSNGSTETEWSVTR